MDSKWWVFAALAVTTLLIFGCTAPSETDDEPEIQMATLNVLVVDETETLVWSGSKTVAPGSNCLTVLRGMTEVQTEDTAFGPFVTGLSGVTAPEGYYWSLFIDNQYATTGIQDCTLYGTKMVMWKLEAIQSNSFQ